RRMSRFAARAPPRLDLAALSRALHGSDLHRVDLLTVLRARRARAVGHRPCRLGMAREQTRRPRACGNARVAGGCMKSLRPAGNLAELPSVTFGHRSLMWWGTLGFMVIEGWTVALLVAAYLYLRPNYQSWPPL